MIERLCVTDLERLEEAHNFTVDLVPSPIYNPLFSWLIQKDMKSKNAYGRNYMVWLLLLLLILPLWRRNNSEGLKPVIPVWD